MAVRMKSVRLEQKPSRVPEIDVAEVDGDLLGLARPVAELMDRHSLSPTAVPDRRHGWQGNGVSATATVRWRRMKRLRRNLRMGLSEPRPYERLSVRNVQADAWRHPASATSPSTAA